MIKVKRSLQLVSADVGADVKGRRWKGGPVRKDRHGSDIFVIEATRNKVRYHVTLSVKTEEDAAVELTLFARDPEAYKAAAQAANAPPTPEVRLDGDTLKAFLKAFRPTVCEKHAVDTERYLMSWMAVLRERDLSFVALKDWHRALADLTPRRHHICALRSFTAWLRKTGQLERGKDSTLDLEIPQTKRARATKAVAYGLKAIETMYAAIENQAVRDVIALRVLTGMHMTEIQRIAAGGKENKVTALKDGGEIVGRVSFWHKKQGWHHQPLGQKAFDAAVRLQKRGSAPGESYVWKLMKEASGGTMRPGALRHSFVTAALESGREVHYVSRGASLDTVRRAVGHTSVDTTGVYNEAMAPLIVLPINLINAEDP